MNENLYDKESEIELINRLSNSCPTEYISSCMQYLDEDCFSSQFGKDWFNIISSLYEKREIISVLSIVLEGEKLGVITTREQLISIASSPSFEDPTYIAAYLNELKRRRIIYAQCVSLSQKILDVTNDVETVADSLKQTAEQSNGVVKSFVSIRNTGEELLNDCQSMINGNFSPGFLCGFRYIDNKGGLQPSDLNIIAGMTSQGKTSLSLSILLGVAKQGIPVAIYSLEMSLKQLTARLASIESGIASSKILTKPLMYHEMENLCSSVANLSILPIYFDDKCNTDIAVIERSIRYLAYNKGVKVVVIDYAQLLTGREKDKRERIASAANNLKAIARQLNICIILVSQLSRPSDGESPVPKLSKLKESGDLENAADNVYLVYRPEWFVGRNLKYPNMSQDWSKYSTEGTGLLIQAKGRNSGLGECLLGFDGPTTRYFDIEQESFKDPFHYDENLKAPY